MSHFTGAALVMGGFLAAVFVLASVRRQAGYTPTFGAKTDPGWQQLLQSQLVWTLGFFFILGGVAAGAVAYVSADPSGQATLQWLLIVATGGVLASWVVYGTYRSSKNRGLTSATAAMVSAWAFGILFVLVIAVKLIVG
ncbi:hypothetical protein [Haloarchaeobius amylolyticus]|uniref:hypothetical protein n=1 Tax=Haloarchaeobius amylolyticus TaxID=1198296 RepID=UPI00226F27C3|nr:hypothetical protein [Haloarchaeobius amylolyticus]